MSSLAKKIMGFCSDDSLQNRINEVIDHLDLEGKERKEVQGFFEERVVDLYKMSLEFSLENNENVHDDEEHEEIRRQFRFQLNYWWLGIQSEWIRYNNLLNYKLAIMNEKDKVLQAKGTICSYFLNPLAQHLSKEELRANMKNLENLVKRSQFVEEEA